MFLKLLEFPKIWNLVFKAKTSEAKQYLEGLISEISEIKRLNGIFKISPKGVLLLPKIFEKFKNYFAKELLNSPCPFSFYLFDGDPELPDLLPLRAGKIYFENSLKDELENLLKEVSIFHKIVDWFELKELVFSVNVDPKLSFFFKDIFLTGKDALCFFCHTNGHPWNSCPGLLISEPWKNFDLLLKENLFQFSEKLWETLKKGESSFKTKEWELFYTRYFFLFPSFLKIISYKFPELESWGGLNLQSNIPVRGGDLGLSLEALELGKIKEAQDRILLLDDGDFRKSLVLSFCSLLRGVFDKANYYLEDALEKVKTNFLKGFLFFLRGYLLYYKGDLFLAEEFFDKALKIDPLCFPAFYFLASSKYQRGEGFSKISLNFVHPWLLTWMYLDPLLLKNQKEVENLLEGKILEKRESAVKRLKEGEDKFFELKPVMNEEEIKKYTEKIETLRKKIYEGGLKAIEKAEEQALELILELQAYIYNQIKNIQESLKEITQEYEKLKFFWEKYPYKQEDIFFGTILKEIGESINKIGGILKKRDVGKEIKFILNNLKENRENLNYLKGHRERLKNKWYFRKRLSYFLKVFLIGEGTLVTLYLLPFFLAPFSPIASIFSFPWFILLSFIILVISLISVKFRQDDELLFMD
ncbi:MAG: hypothetical protein N3A56_02240 [Thermodesulfobacteriaceae bacterium]|nr:hypothetical protein [Thermodesulfobacteriaceae bacterium]